LSIFVIILSAALYLSKVLIVLEGALLNVNLGTKFDILSDLLSFPNNQDVSKTEETTSSQTL
jgi:hypothetical protein